MAKGQMESVVIEILVSEGGNGWRQIYQGFPEHVRINLKNSVGSAVVKITPSQFAGDRSGHGPKCPDECVVCQAASAGP